MAFISYLKISMIESLNNKHALSSKNVYTPRKIYFTSLPKVWPSVHEVKNLGRVQQLFESSEELHALVVPTF